MPEAWTESGSRRRSASNLLGEYGEPFFDDEISRVTDRPSARLTDSSSHSLIGCVVLLLDLPPLSTIALDRL
jgi:hypothetical protein